jgi:hypothetical protein
MDMVRTLFHLFNGDVILLCNIAKELLHPLLYLALQRIAPVLRRPDQVVQGIIDGMGGASEDHAAIVPPSTSVWQGASSPLPNALIPPRRKQRGSLSVFRAMVAPAIFAGIAQHAGYGYGFLYLAGCALIVALGVGTVLGDTLAQHDREDMAREAGRAG